MLAIISLLIVLLALTLPSLLRALDANNDNLDDTWEAQHGISTSAYAFTNLVGWWQLNGTNNSNPASDRSGNGLDGTLSSFPSNAYVPGLFSNALSFTTNSAVSFPTNNTALNTTNQFTFSAWFQSTNIVSHPATIATWSDASTNGWSVGASTNGVANVTFFNAATEQVVHGSSGSVNLYDGTWHQVAATYATNHVATVYVDGVGEATNTITSWTSGAVSSFSFGRTDTNTVNHPFILDEARLYNRALGASEVPQLPATYSDLNGTGLTVFEDYLEGLDPQTTTSIVTSGFAGSGLTAYYVGSTPTLTKTGGDGQTVSASTFASNALVVHIANGSGTALVGAPITFTIPAYSDGSLSLTSGGTTTTSLSLTTDGSGNATVYYKAGAEALLNNTILATAVSTSGNASVTFTAYCGVQNGLALWFKADAGVTQSSGNVGSWTDQSVNGHVVSQSTGANKPQFVTDAITGAPVLRFDGSRWLSSTDQISSSADMTIITVASTTQPTYEEYALWLGDFDTDAARAVGYRYGAQELNACDDEVTGADAPAANTFNIEAATLDSSATSVTFYRNGTQTDAIDFGSALQTVSAGVTVGSAYSGVPGWNGDIKEVLVFTRQLNSTELAQVDGYLADKYGLYDPNATWPSAYSSAIQAEITQHQWNKAQADRYVDFQANNPGMLTNGLSLWLKSDTGVTADGSNNVSAWTDQTGNYSVAQGTSGTQPTYVTSDVGGKPAVRFNGSQWMQNNGGPDPGLNAGVTMITVASSTSPGDQQYSLYLGDTTPTQNRGVGYFSDTQLFDTFAAYTLGGAAPNSNQFVIEETTLDSTLTNAVFYRNGTQTGTGTLSGVGNLTPNVTVGASGSLTSGWEGDIAEVLVYDHQLSPTELAQVDGYLADKYGFYDANATWPAAYSSAVQAEITQHQWNKTQADNYVALQANNPTMLTTGLSLWFKADAGVTADGSNNISAWADQTGNYSVTQSSGGTQPTYVTSDIGGKPAVRFNGSQWLQNSGGPDQGLNTGVTMITVASTTSPGDQQYSIYMGDTTYSQNRGLGYVFGDQLFDTYGVYALGEAAPNSNQFVIEAGTLDSTLTNAVLYRNGTQTGTGTLSGVGNLTSKITVGASGAEVNGWEGDIAEVLVYDHQLSSSELQQVQLYLSGKYGVYYPGAPWISSYTSAVQAEINRNQWTKAQADAYVALQTANPSMLTNGLVTWLKADSGVTQDGSGNVSAWADQTGKYSVSGLSGSEPTFVSSDSNGKPALRFNGSESLQNSALWGSGVSADMTIITVASTTQPTFEQYSTWLGDFDTDGARAVGYVSSAEVLSACNDAVSGGPEPNANTLNVEAVTLDATRTNVTYFQNGNQTTTSSFGGPLQTITPGLSVGSAYSGAAGWNGDIAEVLVYDHQLTSTEMQQVSVYLANKYGLYNPSATWPSAYSSAVQAEITRNQWSKKQADAYVTLQANNSTMVTHGLLAWFKADAGVTQDGSGNVTAWLDQTGNYSVSQSSGGSQPTYVANDVNSLPGLRFNGSEWLYNSNIWGSGVSADMTIITVASTTQPTYEQYSTWLGDFETDGARATGYLSTSQVLSACNDAVTGAAAPSANAFIVEAATLDSSRTNVTYFQNGSQTATASFGSALQPVTPGLAVGSAYTGAAGWNGDIAEVLVYDHQLSPLEMQQVSLYLKNKYAITSLVPVFSGSTTASGSVGTSFSYTISASNSPTSYGASGLPAGLSINTSTGAITGTPTTAGTSTVTLTATNSAGPSTTNLTITIYADNSPVITSSTTASGTEGLAFSYQIVATNTPTSYAASGLPSGLSINTSTGAITGTPTAVGTSTVTLSATNSTGTHTASLVITISTENPPVITSAGSASGTNGSSFSYQIVATNTPTSYGASGLPSGLSINTSTGAITGTPTAAGTSTVTLSATNFGGTSTSNLTITVYSTDPPSITSSATASGAVGGVFNYQITAVNTPTSFSATGLPSGLSLNTSTGLITGTPTATSTSSVTLTATNAYGSGTETLTLTIRAGLTVTSGLAAWFHADAGVTTSSGQVTQWTDQSSNGYNVSQTAGANAPTLGTDPSSGNPCVSFNGSQFLANTADQLAVTGDVTVITVASNNIPSATSAQVVMGNPAISLLGAISDGSKQSLWNGTDVAHGGNVPRGTGLNVNTVTYSQSGSTASFYSQGVANGTASLTASNVSPGMTMGSLFYYSPADGWNGNIAEVIVYNRVLTSTERQEVETYLADKYGIYAPGADWIGSYSSDVQDEINRNQWSKTQADAYVTLQTNNSSMLTDGLLAWFKADVGISHDGSNKVSAWADQTGNFNLTQSQSSNQPTVVSSDINSKPALRFSAAQALSLPASLGVGVNADMTMITVGKTIAPSAYQYGLYLGNGITGTSRAVGYQFGKEYLDVSGGYASGGAAPGSGAFAVEITTVDSTLSTATFYRDGTQTGTASLSGLQNVTPGISVGNQWQGDIAEVLVYDHQLSSTEIQEVGVYLADKYGTYNPNATWPSSYSSGVQAEITRNQWTKAQADAYVAFQTANSGMLTDGLKLWLKADAGVTKAVGPNVASWADQTGNFTLSQNNIYNQPTFVSSDSNGEPAMRFSQSQLLSSTASMGSGVNADMTIITVGMTTAPTATEYSLGLGNGSTGSGRTVGYQNSTQYFTTTGTAGSGAAVPATGTFAIEVTSVDSALANVTFYRGGAQTGTASLSGVQNVTPGIAVGNQWQGEISEVLVYDHALSSTERDEACLYLANKYGLYYPSATWISSYSSGVQTQINANQWNKTQADAYVSIASTLPVATGLTAWFRADSGVLPDIDTGAVTTWQDSSMNHNDVTQQTLSTEPTLVTDSATGKPSVHFNGSQYLSNYNNYPNVNDVTIITVASTPSPTALGFFTQVAIGYGGGYSSSVRGLAYNTGAQSFWGGFWEYVQGGAVDSNTGLTMSAITYTSSTHTAAFYRNGVANGTAALATSPVTQGLSLGSSYFFSNGNNWNGNISEVLIYNRVLNSTELASIQTYLSSKYAPYPFSAPTISPNGGNFSSSATVTLSGATSPAVIRYTTDGSAPTNSSTQYTTALSLTQDTKINCAIFSSGVQVSPVATAQFWVGDTNHIGIPDSWQIANFGALGIVDPNAQSPGGSGLTNLQAYQWGYNPTMFSTNGDGLSDLVNHQLGYAATDTDINGYGLTNAQQLALGLDPFDTGVNPSPPTPPTPDSSDHTAPVINLNQPANATLLP